MDQSRQSQEHDLPPEPLPAPGLNREENLRDHASALHYWAREQGKSYQAAFDEAASTALASGQKTVGDVLIRFLIRGATGMYYLEEGQLVWEEPSDFRLQVAVAVCDARDLRFLPGLEVYVTLYDANHAMLGDHHHTFLWDPAFFHYGRNWNAPAEDTFTLRVGVEMPNFPRHDQVDGKRYASPFEVEFKRVKLAHAQH